MSGLAEGTLLLGSGYGLRSRDCDGYTPEGCPDDRSPAPSPEKFSGDFSGDRFFRVFRSFSEFLDERW